MTAQNSKNTPDKNLTPLPSTKQTRENVAPSPAAEETDPLTPRQKQILLLVAQGLTNKEMAVTLDCSIQNVEKHLAKIYGTLNASNRAQAVSVAKDRGWLPRNVGEG